MIDEQEFKARIEYARALTSYSKTELANRINMPLSTFRRKMEKPSRLTLEEFVILMEALPNGILIDYLKEVIDIKAIKKLAKIGTGKKEIS